MRWTTNHLLSAALSVALCTSTLVAQEASDKKQPDASSTTTEQPATARTAEEREGGEKQRQTTEEREKAPDDRTPRRAGFGGPGAPGGGRMMMSRMPVLAALDADGDREISAAEIEGAVAALKKLDKNSDGKLTADELMPAGMPFPGGPFSGVRPVEPAEMIKFIMMSDTNNDGFIDKEEAPERLEQVFARIDTNSDSKLSRDEVAKFAEQMRSRARREEAK